MQTLKRFQLSTSLTCNAEAKVCSDNLHKIAAELFWKCLVIVQLPPSDVTVTAINRSRRIFIFGFMDNNLNDALLEHN